MVIRVYDREQLPTRAPACWIEIDRPGSANALDVDTLVRLCEAIESAANESRAAVVVLSATGRHHFCGGADQNEARSPQRTKDFRRGLGRLLIDLVRIEKPVVAAVGGAAVGAGAMIACVADRSIMADDTFLSFPELDVSVPPLLAYDLVAEMAGAALARDLTITGRRVTAAECLRHGLVAELAPRSHVREAAEAAAAALAAKPKEAFALFKRHVASRFEPLIERAIAKQSV